MQHRIVVWDPSGKFPIGDIIEGDKAISLLHGHGGLTLPIEPHLLGRNAVSGYFRRDWGRGTPFTNMVGTRGCPMLIYVVPDFAVLNWAIRVEPIPGAPESRGTFRLTMHTGQVGTISGGLAADGAVVEFADRPIDPHGGVTIVGSSKLNCTMEGYLGLSIYGTAVGVRVLWSAVSQSR